MEEELNRAIALLADLVDRWPDEGGYGHAIARAREFVLYHRLRWPRPDDVRAAVKTPR